MTGRLKGKRALITAAANGIGRETALAYAKEGAHVFATDIDGAALSALKKSAPDLEIMRLDVTNGEAISALADLDLDILFNCAGFVDGGTILDCDETDWNRSMEINVRSMYRTIRAVLPGMVERGNGSVINMSSVASSVIGVPNRFVYGVTKAAVIGMTKHVAADFVGQGVRCNAICPGTVQTPSLDNRINAMDNPDEARKAFIARQPMGRLGLAIEVAMLAVYLGSDESAYTTGTTHVIDGGWSLL